MIFIFISLISSNSFFDSMPYNASTDVWYQYFGGSGAQWWIMLAFYGFRAALATIGLLFNCSMVYVTAKSKSLNGICNILLATESGLAILQDANFHISFGVVLSGLKFIRYNRCFWLLVPGAIFGDTAQMAMLITGFDRCFAVLFPVWYKLRNKKRYLSIVGLLLCCFAVYDFIVSYIDFLGMQNVMVTCSTEEMGQGGMGPVMKVKTLALSVALIAVYGLTWLLVFQLSATSENLSASSKRVAKSILLIVALHLVGVSVRQAVNLGLSFASPNVFVSRSFSLAMSCFVIVVYSANAPVLYAISDEYAKVYNKHFKWLPKLLERKTPVQQLAEINTSGIELRHSATMLGQQNGPTTFDRKV